MIPSVCQRPKRPQGMPAIEPTCLVSFKRSVRSVRSGRFFPARSSFRLSHFCVHASRLPWESRSIVSVVLRLGSSPGGETMGIIVLRCRLRRSRKESKSNLGTIARQPGRRVQRAIAESDDDRRRTRRWRSKSAVTVRRRRWPDRRRRHPLAPDHHRLAGYRRGSGAVRHRSDRRPSAPRPAASLPESADAPSFPATTKSCENDLGVGTARRPIRPRPGP